MRHAYAAHIRLTQNVSRQTHWRAADVRQVASAVRCIKFGIKNVVFMSQHDPDDVSEGGARGLDPGLRELAFRYVSQKESRDEMRGPCGRADFGPPANC